MVVVVMVVVLGLNGGGVGVSGRGAVIRGGSELVVRSVRLFIGRKYAAKVGRQP